MRIVPGAQAVDLADPANTADVIRLSDMYKNFYSAQGSSIIGTPSQSRLLTKPLLRNVLHGGGLIFDNDADPNARLIAYWITHPMPQGRTSSARPTACSRPRRLPPPARATRNEVAARRAVPGGRQPAGAGHRGSGAAAEADEERVQITDPYIELRTGAGRGYPVFHVAARDEWITIELRHTDWYKVRTAAGKVGWVSRAQLQTTLTEAGVAKSFRDLAVDDYLVRRRRPGRRLGPVRQRADAQDLEQLPASATRSASKPRFGQVQGTYSGANFWQLNLLAEPWSDQRFSPFSGIGVGRFNNFPNLSLVDAAPTNANLANAVLGARYYLSERFVLRADFTLYTVFLSERRTNEYHAFSLGLAFFF